jgi:hypothetical protein
MNSRQKIAFWIGFGVLLIVALFPPVDVGRHPQYPSFKPFHFVLSPIMPPGYPDRTHDADLTKLVADLRKIDGGWASSKSESEIINAMVDEPAARDFPAVAAEIAYREQVRRHHDAFDRRPFRILIGDLALRLAVIAGLTGAAVWALKTPRKEASAG